jgi:hypothetical protein
MLKKSFACKFILGGSVLCGTRSKIKTFTVTKLLLSDQWSLKGPFRSFGATRSQAMLTHIDYCVTKTIATGQNIDRKYFLSLADQQSVDQQAFKVVSSFIKLPVGSLMSDSCEEHTETVTVHSSNIVSHNQNLLKPGLINDSQSPCPLFF